MYKELNIWLKLLLLNNRKMNKINSLLVILFLIVALSNCSVYLEKKRNYRFKIIEDCRKKWIYQELQNSFSIKILVFNPKSAVTGMKFPNFIIGMTKEKELIAIIDKDFENNLKKGTEITVKPIKWTLTEKENLMPMFTVEKRRKDRELYCKVKTIYYGEIIKVD